ncbi:SIS domain-containing protein [Zopfia rhizophila CBS 207.26]|uniref:SIS domain-containing protein n=1 Tax=Zopfia rhizophila CBS 207.26 TaxID=1314779 RepID=A0A6A6DNA8_9PEZI|nr:SIS domain-containing protein [Zopfia rhizophila CBS 207.26]
MANSDFGPSSPSLKRKRSTSLPLTPPLSMNDPEGARILDRAANVLSTAATALLQVTILYQSDHIARDGLLRAVDCITKVYGAGGKLIICAVGKSGLVGKKIVATMKSLGLGSSFLHGCEAIHGDLGDVRKQDAIMFLSYSGRTPELLKLLSHLPESIPVLVITSHKTPAECPLLTGRSEAILLPAPIHESEETSFGVCAPTTSTTVAIAVGDMLALTIAEAMHQEDTKQVFQTNHPGGAIGAKKRSMSPIETKEENSLKGHQGLVLPK